MNELAQNRRWQHPLVWAGGLLLCAFVVSILAREALKNGVGWPCIFLNVTGVPCPTCGATRTFAALAQLDLLSAFKFNPLLAAGAVLLALAPFAWKRISTVNPRSWLILGGLVLLNWAYLCIFLPR